MNNLEFADIRLILFVPLCDCNIAALMHRTLHRMVGLDLELCLKFVLSKVF